VPAPGPRADDVYRDAGPAGRAAQADAGPGAAAAVTDEGRRRTAPPDSRRGALIGLLVAVLLVVGGLALVHVLRRQGRLEDCLMSGRSNCAPIDPAAVQR
jgi:hypothetical protein